MTVTRKRGRPKSAATIQRENELAEIEKVFQDAAASRSMSCKDRKEMNDLIESLARWEEQILEEYHVSPMKKDLAYAMASLGDESLAGYEDSIIEAYERAQSQGVTARAIGTKSNKKSAENRRDQALKVHSKKIDALLKQGRGDSHIAEIICKKFPIDCRPSTRTIRRWLAQYRCK
jgi:hypothetical protein